MMAAHVFKYSRDFQGGKRICGECRRTYDQGEHQHVAVLKPYTSYICPNDTGLGHSAVWSGAQNVPELRTPTDDRCICGAQFVEEDREVWRLSWEYVSPWTGDWTPTQRDGSKHSTRQQRDGLRTMPAEVRNVRLRKIGE